jgi:hypothetical protein
MTTLIAINVRTTVTVATALVFTVLMVLLGLRGAGGLVVVLMAVLKWVHRIGHH